MNRSKQPFPHKSILLLEPLAMAWNEGWLDEFSQEHFLIKALEGRLTTFQGQTQLKYNQQRFQPFVSRNSQEVCINFCYNFANKTNALIDLFGKDNIKKFFMDQVSAGKENYDECQFIRALSEISVLSYLSILAKSAQYEPLLNGKKNPEARFLLHNDIVLDVEVKTPGFNESPKTDDIAIPTILLSKKGRDSFLDYCKSHSIAGYMPRVYKLIEFLNNAADKFENVDHVKHLNMLFINWTLSEFLESSFEEAYSLLTNPINGLLINKTVGKEYGVSEDVYNKITAVVVYTESLDGLMFCDFRYVWGRDSKGEPHFRLCPINEKTDLFPIIRMLPSAPSMQVLIYYYNPAHSNCAGELLSIINNNIYKR